MNGGKLMNFCQKPYLVSVLLTTEWHKTRIYKITTYLVAFKLIFHSLTPMWLQSTVNNILQLTASVTLSSV